MYIYIYSKSLQSCLTLYDPMDCSPLGSSVHGILQARILKWAAMPSSRGSFQPRDLHLLHVLHCQAGSLSLAPPGKSHTHTHTHTHTVKYYSAVRKEEILPFATTSMDHEGITLSKITQRKTNIYNVTYMWILKKLNSPKHKLEW